MRYPRYLQSIISKTCFTAGKMAFVSGPRQCGKTTMAKTLLKKRKAGAYYNWDETTFRKLWTKNPALILPTLKKTKSLILLDELHKAKLWKRNLKGLYDTQQGLHDILVTGSARLNVYKKGGDSLLGRYYHFRLHPFSVAELLKEAEALLPDQLIKAIFHAQPEHSKKAERYFEQLLKFGPFPEPLFSANKNTLNLWQRNRIEKIIREDLRDLSHLPELSQVEMLASLLPERVAQPLSIKSLQEDLEVAYTTVKRWLNYLVELYYIFLLKPYAKSLARSIKKENKLYLWDWSEVEKPGPRFENAIAGHLLKYCDYLTDSGEGNFELRYLKNKEHQEIGFLIVRDKKPWLPIEAKLSDATPSHSWGKMMTALGCSHAIQLVKTPGVYKQHQYAHTQLVVMSAADFLKLLI